MRRHPHAIVREQRAMTQARTARRHHRDSDTEDARDTDPVVLPPETRTPHKVVQLHADGSRTLITTAPRSAAVLLAVRELSRCLVVARNGKIYYDNKKDFR